MVRLGRRWGWTVAFLVVLASTAVGLIAYSFGVSHGIAQSGADPDWYGSHRPWGFGFLFLPLFFTAWMILSRWWWGWGGPWRHRYYYPEEYGPLDAPEPWQRRFDEWHRRSHERMKEPPPADDPGHRG